MSFTAESVYLGAILCGLLYLLYSGRIRPDLASLLVMVALMVPWRPTADGLAAVLKPAEALSGFGTPAVVMVGAMFVLSAAVVHTGAADLIGRRALEAGASSEFRFQLTVLILVTLFSAFINDTTTVLIWMPLVLRVCRDRGYAPSRVLILLAYGSLLGGQWTLIGTRSNLILSDYLRARTGDGIGFFAFTPYALLVTLGVLGFFVTFGRRLLPRGSAEPTLASRYDVQEYVTEVIATPGPETQGRTLGELGLDERHGVAVLEVIRGESRIAPSSWIRLFAGDVLIIRGRMEAIPRVLAERGLSPRREMAVGDRELRSVDLRLAEAVVAPQSQLAGTSLQDLDFDRRYGVSPLAISRRGRSLRDRPLTERLQVGDSILLLGLIMSARPCRILAPNDSLELGMWLQPSGDLPQKIIDLKNLYARIVAHAGSNFAAVGL
jgi:di/tricarboxylate transporter